jgi:hypothetical protein
MRFLPFAALFLLLPVPALPQFDTAAYAQTPAPAASPAVSPLASLPIGDTVVLSAGPKPPTTFDKFIEMLKSSGGFIASFLVLFEVLVRVFPSKSPLSVLVPVKYFVDSAVLILQWLSTTLLLPLINIANKSETKLEPPKKGAA